MKYVLLVGLAFLGGCVTAGKNDNSSYKSINVIDQTQVLRPLSHVVIGGGEGYLGVGDHDIVYKFECVNDSYTVVFSVEAVNEDNLSVSLSKITSDGRRLRAENVAEINKGFKGAETVGPVGLRCPIRAERGLVSLTVRIAQQNTNSSGYIFGNKTFQIQTKDFK